MRYHFDLLDPRGVTRDAEGVELAGLDQVRMEARRAICGIAMDDADIAVENLTVCLRVRDENDVIVYEMSVSIQESIPPH